MTTASPLVSEGQIVGAVALVRSAEDLAKAVYQITSNQPSSAMEDILGHSPAIRDEVGDCSLRLQVKLLRALDSAEHGSVCAAYVRRRCR